ncbi:hypothetical protein [Corallococcus sp. RDP092CA]|uniref:hypothetical protein n=1 Tax=Corallococcus sp. RDP092CA TaxID=3109369 RepID=UPI0035B26050
MATLQPFFASGTQTGSKEIIETQIVFWVNIGTGVFSNFNNFSASFQGTIDTAFYKGPLNLDIQLTDESPGAQRGPARVTVNGSADNNATYQVQGHQLIINATISGKAESIAIYQGDGGTYLGLNGAVSRTVWLKPS